MKKLLLLTLILSAASAQAQNLEWKRGTLQVDGQSIQQKKWESQFSNQEALDYVQKAKANAGPANVIGFIGGFMIGWPLGTALAGGEPEWAVAGVGVGLIVVAIPMITATKKNMQKAIQIENGGTMSGAVRLDFHLDKSGIGFALKF